MDKLVKLISDTATRHVCGYAEVLDVCTEWLVSHGQSYSELHNVVELYATARDVGHSHYGALKGCMQLRIARLDKPKKIENLEKYGRLIRDE